MRIELHPIRALNALVLLVWLGGITAAFVTSDEFLQLLAPYLVYCVGIQAAVLIFDLGSSVGQRRNFIEDAEKRGMTQYAEELRGRKV